MPKKINTYVILAFDPTVVNSDAGPFEGISVLKIVNSDHLHDAQDRADRIVNEYGELMPGWYFMVSPVREGDVI